MAVGELCALTRGELPMRKRAAVTLACVFLSAPAMATDKHPGIVANKGIAFSLEDEKGVVVAYDSVAAFEHTIIVADCEHYSVLFEGVKWCFVNAANQQKLTNQMSAKDGSMYIPMFGGRCTQGVSNGKGDPRTAVLVRFSSRKQDERLFLNGSYAVRTAFLGNTSKVISEARQNWRTAEWLGMIVPNDRAK
jgi:hypothetical protein